MGDHLYPFPLSVTERASPQVGVIPGQSAFGPEGGESWAWWVAHEVPVRGVGGPVQMGECSPSLLWLWVLAVVVARPVRGHPRRPGRPVSILGAIGTPLCWRPLAVRSCGVPQQPFEGPFEGPWGPLGWHTGIPSPVPVQCHYHIFATLVYVAAPHRFLSPSFLPPRLSHGAMPWCVSLPQPCYGPVFGLVTHHHQLSANVIAYWERESTRVPAAPLSGALAQARVQFRPATEDWQLCPPCPPLGGWTGEHIGRPPMHQQVSLALLPGHQGNSPRPGLRSFFYTAAAAHCAPHGQSMRGQPSLTRVGLMVGYW